MKKHGKSIHPYEVDDNMAHCCRGPKGYRAKTCR